MNDRLATALTKTTVSRYGELTYFSNDSGAIRTSLEKYGEWAENEIRFMKNFIPVGGTVIDVGGYIGTHAIAFADAVGPSGHIISIEAQRHSFELLQKNVTINNFTHVQIENAIVGDRIEFRELDAIEPDKQNSFGSTLVASKDQGRNGATRVQAITVDSLMLPRCDLLKIDVEGMEEDVLKGASETLHTLKPTVYAECNSLQEGLRTLLILKQRGYTIFAHVVDAFNADNFFGNKEDVFQGGREIAIVGTIGLTVQTCLNYTPKSCELLLKIETADDLALALLNKPQYFSEIMQVSAAGRSGGSAFLDQQAQTRLDLEACLTDLAQLRTKANADAATMEQSDLKCAWLKADNMELTRDISILRKKIMSEEETKNHLSYQLEHLKNDSISLALQVGSLQQALAELKDRHAIEIETLKNSSKPDRLQEPR